MSSCKLHRAKYFDKQKGGEKRKKILPESLPELDTLAFLLGGGGGTVPPSHTPLCSWVVTCFIVSLLVPLITISVIYVF